LEKMRLQKYMAMCGVASRRKAEELIDAGRVKVDGVVVDKQGVTVDPNNRVEVDGKLVKLETQKKYIMLNKPEGYVSTAKDQFDRPTVLDLVKGVSERVYPVGRLDYETEGLLILTNDGELANRLSHPSHHVDKEYLVVVKGPFSQDIGEIFTKGIVINGKQTKPAKIEHVLTENRKTTIRVILSEGRNRQIRRTFEAVNREICSLKRVAVGEIKLGEMNVGKWRELNSKEVKYLKSL